MAYAELEKLLEAPSAPGLDALGMPVAIVDRMDAALRRRGGLICVAGPSGSGTTTTLRALADRCGGQGRAIGTDVLLVDALDDADGAAAAIEAALDGRLVLAGVAGGTAVAALAQLRRFGVEPYQLAAALTAVTAQRLVRRLCRACRVPVQAEGSVSALLGFDPGAVVFLPGGCDSCRGSGYASMTGVFEAVFPDPALRRLIATGGDEAILARHAFLHAPNLGAVARTLVREGVTTPDEAVRVSRG